ncbi:MAG: FAD:protein FMN transferase [Phycisphaerales bacterium]|nr:FAD:protein FMN transferase [Phycisphaerales bacterium]
MRCAGADATDGPPHGGTFLVLIIALCSMLCGCAANEQALGRFEYAKIVMGVKARLTLYAPDEAVARRAARAGFDRLTELDAVMSDYREDSELMRLCRAPAGQPAAVSNDLYHVLERAGQFSAASNGAFDITVGPASRLWRQARARSTLPTPADLEAARTHMGWRYVILDPDHRHVMLAKRCMLLDLGGIGKGFAADEAVAAMAQAGAARSLVDLGGDLVAGDPPPGRTGWRIALDPFPREMPPIVIDLANAAIATSGDIEQFLELDGERYSHIIDPRTAMALTSRIAVTIIARDGTTADALASAVSVLGPIEGISLVERVPGASARISTWMRDGIITVQTGGFPDAPADQISK